MNLTTTTNQLSQGALERAAKHKGRAYQCLRCLHRNGEEVVDVRGRIEDHIMKIHLSLDQVPFYCRLCQFRCADQGHLDRHVEKYRRHVQLARELGVADSTQYLVSNPQPYRIGDADWLIFSKEQSLQTFLKKKGATSSPGGRDILQQVLDNTLMDDLFESLTAGMESPTRRVEEAAATEATLPTESAATMLNTTLTTTTNPPAAHSHWAPSSSPVDKTLTPLDLTARPKETNSPPTSEVVEDILPQLLGKETIEPEPTSNRQRREESPDRKCYTELIEVMKRQAEAIQKLTEAVISNSRTIRCLEKTLKEQAENKTNQANQTNQTSQDRNQQPSRAREDSRPYNRPRSSPRDNSRLKSVLGYSSRGGRHQGRR